MITGSATPLVSIIVPTKNRFDLLAETIASVQGQSYPHWELLIVDDGSTDQTVEQGQRVFGDDVRIRFLVRRGEKGGAPVCRNQGFAASRGEYVLFLDSDDLLLEQTLAGRVAFLQAAPELDYCVAQAFTFREKIGDSDKLFNAIGYENALKGFLTFDWPWQTSGPLWRRHAWERIGQWDEELRVGQDMDISCRALVIGLRYRWLEKPDFYYRLMNDISSKVGTNPFAPTKLPSQVRRISRLNQLLLAQGTPSPEIQALIQGNYLLFAQQWVRAGQLADGLQTWEQARLEGVVDGKQYQQGVTFLRLTARGWGGLMESSLRRTWPPNALFLFGLWHLDNLTERRAEMMRQAIRSKDQGKIGQAIGELAGAFRQSPGIFLDKNYHRLFVASLLALIRRKPAKR